MSTVSTDTYDQVGIRESLADSIWDVSPEEVPFSSNCSRVSVDNTYFEWQTDSLAAVSAATAVEGADASFAPAAATTRVGNYTEILTKTAITSGTLEATDRAGRAREMAYQIVKRAKEIKRDFEHHLVGVNNSKAVGNATTARETGSYSSWVVSNSSFGATGSGAGGGTAKVDGTNRAFTEALLGTVIDNCFVAGGKPDIIMVGPANKRIMNSFAGMTTFGSTPGNVLQDASAKKIINAVSLYESDYGIMKIVPNRFVRDEDVLVYEKSYFAIAELRGMMTKDIAPTGDAEKKQVIMEAGLMVKNEASSGAIYDTLG